MKCNLCIVEAFAEEDDLSNQGRVGHNHGDGSEHRLEVVGQLRATRVTRVHRDEDADCVVEADVFALKHEALLLRFDRVLNAFHLSRSIEKQRIMLQQERRFGQ